MSEQQEPADETEEQPNGIWVATRIKLDGSPSYKVTISLGPSVIRSINAEEAVRYVAAVYRTAVIAEHDAAVMRQLNGKIGMPLELAGSVVMDLRADRDSVRDDATLPLRFDPIISARTFDPYVHVWMENERIAQWTPEDCFQHATQVMQVLSGADLDSAYLRYLVEKISLPRGYASQLVNDLGNYRTGLSEVVPRGADE